MRGAVRKLALVLMLLLLRWSLAAPATAIAGDLDYPPTNYVLRSIDGTQVIGHSHITVTPGADDLYTVRGEYHFLNGDYDIDETTLRGNSDGSVAAGANPSRVLPSRRLTRSRKPRRRRRRYRKLHHL